MANEDCSGYSAKLTSKLLDAVKENELDQVEELLERGADPNADDQDSGQKLIHLASARANGIEVLDALVTKGANVNATNKGKLTPLGVSITQTRLEHVEYLLDKGVDVNAIAGNNEMKPLHLAVKESTLSMCKLLLEKGASSNLPDDKVGNTPLHYVAKCNVNKTQAFRF